MSSLRLSFLVVWIVFLGCSGPGEEDLPGRTEGDVQVDVGKADVGFDATGEEWLGDVDALVDTANDDTANDDAANGDDAADVGDGDAAADIVDEADGADVNDDDETGLEPWSCAPALELDARRYVTVEGLDGEALLDGLLPMVSGHYSAGYNDARDYMFAILEPQGDGKIECVYTGRRVTPDGTRTPGGFDTEHSWPQSKGASSEPAKSDLHHLFPSDSTANNRRGSYEYGNVDCDPYGCSWGQSGSYLGGSEDDDREVVFEVRPERRGDIARAIFYFALRYDRDVFPREESVLRRWHCEDPPDAFERARNAGIEALQGNRNPFIDRPDFIDRIGDF